jgi:hypothetical protein
MEDIPLMHVRRLATGALVGLVASALLIAPAAAASNNIIVTYAGNGQTGYSGDGGAATSAKLNTPSGVFLDNASHVFFDDTYNNVVRYTDASVPPKIFTLAGNGSPGYSGDNGPATSAKLSQPQGVVVTSGGTIYIADTGNNVIRKVDKIGGTITTYAGTGAQGWKDGTASGAQFNHPTGLAVDSAGNLFVADTHNDVVRKVTMTGTVTTIAGGTGGSTVGVCGFSGNTGPATNAQMCSPTGLAVSGSALLISDTENNQVRHVLGGTITAFAGKGASGYDGDGGQAVKARLNRPTGVSYDTLGDVYIIDVKNDVIRQVTASGVISTFAGIAGHPGFSGDNGAAEQAMIGESTFPGDPQNLVAGVTTDPVGDGMNVFFSDSMNNRVRRIHKGGPPPALPEARNILLASSALLLLGGATFVVGRRRRHGPASEPAVA